MMDGKESPKVNLKSNYILETPQCSICMDDLIEDLMTISKCGHVFHSIWY